MLTWVPMCVYYLCIVFNETAKIPLPVKNFIGVLTTQTGTLTALIFFAKSKEARRRWKDLLEDSFGAKFAGKVKCPVPDDFGEMNQYVRRLATDKEGGFNFQLLLQLPRLSDVFWTRSSAISSTSVALGAPLASASIGDQSNFVEDLEHLAYGGTYEPSLERSSSKSSSVVLLSNSL